ncbi:MAG: ABC transporter permease, partial [Ruminococcus sp.]|nr:ABC transporter permease [Ruminococcus sp.]
LSRIISSGIIIVPDDIILDNYLKYNKVLGNYKVTNKNMRLEVEGEIKEIIDDNYIAINSKLDIAASAIGLGALVTFIGMYLGIIFLISCAAILALKELSEASDNKERYNMLRKIGVSEVNINNSLFKETAIFFMAPLILAIIHSIFGIIFCNKILEVVSNDKLLPSIIMTSVFLIFIYGGYFLITYFCSRSIIREK